MMTTYKFRADNSDAGYTFVKDAGFDWFEMKRGTTLEVEITFTCDKTRNELADIANSKPAWWLIAATLDFSAAHA